MTFTDINHARATADKANSAWWAFYKADPTSEWTRDARTAAETIRADALAQFGTPDPSHPDCAQCLSISVFGGPRHAASKRCESGRHPHCACDTCW